MYILGINCYGHDSSAALVKDGSLVCAGEEERFNRQKHYSWFPEKSVQFCLEHEKIKFSDISKVAYYWQPWQEPGNIIKHVLRYLPHSLKLFSGASLGIDFKKRFPLMLRLKSEIKARYGVDVDVEYVPHHACHAASAFYPSGFDESAILCLDGIGEWSTAWFGQASGTRVSKIKSIEFPHSLGFLYSAITKYVGFEPNDGEWKVMGLAPYGKPTFYSKFCDILTLEPEGGFKLDLQYFDYHLSGAKRWVSPKFLNEFGPQRSDDSDEIGQHYIDIAASMQKRVEDAMVHCASYLQKLTKSTNLCLAGGVALNCVANGIIAERAGFTRVFVPPSPGDSGTSIGAALNVFYRENPTSQNVSKLHHAYLGPSFTNDEIKVLLDSTSASYEYFEDIEIRTAKLIAAGKIIGWFNGRMEFGPRALGARSIIANPAISSMKDEINARVKFREGFRPFAPSVLEEHQKDFFENDLPSRFMSFIFKIRRERHEEIPAVTHIDGTGRLQTVSKELSPSYWRMINEFYKITGIPLILNTSFNVKGEPIVCSPMDALNCFRKANLDYLVLNNFLVRGDGQKSEI
jgi:carbamoyltransferase